ncbi:MAG: M20/M25/M40 family metallo-hydrolase [Patescibacteria group bacterium]|jgi:tripeptide aminopeptidase
MTRLVKTFLKYVKISSPSHHEAALSRVIKKDLTALGVKTKVDKAGNLIGYLPGKGVPLLLNAHMDTVQPCQRIRPVVRGDVIQTDGTSVLGADDKAGIAEIIEAITLLKERGVKHPPLEIIFTTSEETFSEGAAALDFSQIHAPVAYVIDGGGVGELDYHSAYLADIRVNIRGKAAHSGVDPEKGISAIKIAATAIHHMKLGRIDQTTTANIGIITGGSIRNSIPAEVFLHGEARSFSKRKIEDQIEHMSKTLQDACETYGGLLELCSNVAVDGYKLKKSDLLLKHVMSVMTDLNIVPNLVACVGSTDANTFIKHGIKAVNIGTGGCNLHTVDEYIKISDLAKNVELLYTLVHD